MKCYYHEDREGKLKCDICQKQICEECSNNEKDNIICDECLAKEVFDGDTIVMETKYSNHNSNREQENILNNNYYPVKRIPNSFLGFIFSLVPGAGHMYLGLMKRGVQLMIAFFMLLAIPSILNFAGFIGLFATVVWFYSVFDAYHIKKRLMRGDIVEDELVVEMDWLNMNYYYLGLGLLIFGGLALLNQGLYSFQYIFNIATINIGFKVFRFLREITLPILLIVAGIVLIKRSKN
ncbi:hypothetical protein GOQ27_05835 [Clostridium sp. D2Q-11]|uniref:B box-type domain-containing protein n=1 Tax=Anaeromonas frigoriresistens TaxID=2683708 RepID=A0A942UYJ7_9FIRM|nr:hypothetical protein [Anaeromonas frigoriresistens]MBS4537972.1 hypothetical protein [Anaeromonas frigoriresistens]